MSTLRLIRGFVAYVLVFRTPLDRVNYRTWLWLTQYAGDWIYRANGLCPGGDGRARDCIAKGECGCSLREGK